MDKRAVISGIMVGSILAVILILASLVIYNQKISKAAAEADALTSPSTCIDKKATAKSFLLRISQFAAKKLSTGEENPLYEAIYSPRMALDEYIVYFDCLYKDKIFGSPTDPGKDETEKKLHKAVVACGNAAMVNLNLDYQAAIEKSTDAGEKKVYATKMKALKNTAKGLRYTGSLTDTAVADACRFDYSLG